MVAMLAAETAVLSASLQACSQTVTPLPTWCLCLLLARLLRCGLLARLLLQLYQLLSDRFPFWDVDLHQMDSLGGAAIREGILHGPVLFPLQPWCTAVHSSAQDLIIRMLERDVQKRITAAEALEHPWFKQVLGA